MTAEQAPEDAATPAIEVVRGAPTDDELAALLAVVSEAYVAEAEAGIAPPPRRSRWDITARQLRTPVRRELGWGGFPR